MERNDERDENGLGADESLDLIRDSIRGARRVHAADGRYLVAWGLPVLAAAVASFLLAANGARGTIYMLPWVAAYAVGFLVSFLVSRSVSGASRASSPASRAATALWTGFVVAALVLAIPAGTGALAVTAYVSALCALLGLANWGVAAALGAPWYRFPAALWWMGALAIPFLDRSAIPLVSTALVLLGQVLPGSILLIRNLRGRGHA